MMNAFVSHCRSVSCALCVILAWTFATFVRAAGPHEITVNVDPGKSYQSNVGSGFKVIEREGTTLKIELTTSEGTIESSKLVEAAIGADWKKIDETHWECKAIDPNDKFWCVIKCMIKKPTIAKGKGGRRSGRPGPLDVCVRH